MSEVNKTKASSPAANKLKEGEVSKQPNGATSVAQPLTDIYESKQGATLYVDLPGVRKESVDIYIDQNILTVKGEIGLDMPENLRPHYMDIRLGVFERQFSLGEELDCTNIQANFNQGELKLFIPVAEQHKPHRIEVKTVK
jgi:HSP20 family molecular chaperone IbpA